MIWLLIIGVFLLSLALLLSPLFRRSGVKDSPTPQNTHQDMAVYKAQLQELDGDQKNGLLSEAEVASARLEIERRLLKASSEPDQDMSLKGASWGFLAMAVTVILLATVGFYLTIGQPGMPDFALKNQQHSPSRMAEKNAESQDKILKIQQEVVDLKRHLAETPDNIKAWHALGQYQSQLRNKAEAAQAFQQWYERDPGNIDAAIVYGESLIMLSDGQVSPAALLVLNRARKIQPRNPGVRHYLSLAAYQAGNVSQALAGWKSLEADSKPGVPWMRQLKGWIQRAERDLGVEGSDDRLPAPTLSEEQQQAIADMSQEEQSEMIKGMVGRLQEKMEQNPENIEGWFRLAKAYMVLGQKQDAIASLEQAEKYAPEDVKGEIKKQLEILRK